MNDLEIINRKLDAIMAHLGISTAGSKFMTARQAENHFGINAQTLLNRSKLDPSHKRYIPTVRISGGRNKYFEKKVLERLLELDV